MHLPLLTESWLAPWRWLGRCGAFPSARHGSHTTEHARLCMYYTCTSEYTREQVSSWCWWRGEGRRCRRSWSGGSKRRGELLGITRTSGHDNKGISSSLVSSKCLSCCITRHQRQESGLDGAEGLGRYVIPYVQGSSTMDASSGLGNKALSK